MNEFSGHCPHPCTVRGCINVLRNPGQMPGFGYPGTGAGIDGQGPLTPPLTTFESKFPPAIRAGPRKPASAAASGVGSGREIRFLPRAGARFPPNFTPSTQLSRSCPAAGRALPLPALPSGMHGHSRQQIRKARPLAEKGREARPARQRRVTNDRCKIRRLQPCHGTDRRPD